MAEKEIPFRQIHLDFHTSEAIEGVCSEFDAEEFAQTLADAHVNSITLFLVDITEIYIMIPKCFRKWSILIWHTEIC